MWTELPELDFIIFKSEFPRKASKEWRSHLLTHPEPPPITIPSLPRSMMEIYKFIPVLHPTPHPSSPCSPSENTYMEHRENKDCFLLIVLNHMLYSGVGAVLWSIKQTSKAVYEMVETQMHLNQSSISIFTQSELELSSIPVSRRSQQDCASVKPPAEIHSFTLRVKHNVSSLHPLLQRRSSKGSQAVSRLEKPLREVCFSFLFPILSIK